MKNTCNKCGSKNMVYVEYNLTMPEHYDGWSETMCMEEKCGARIGRWTDKELADGEYELPLGGR